MILKTILFISILFLFGCQKIPLDSGKYYHSLNVQWDGEPWYYATNPKGVIGDEGEPVLNFDEQLKAIEKNNDFKSMDQVMIFIHGGLNKLGSNQNRTVETLKKIKEWNDEIKANKKKNISDPRLTIYPIIINWHSQLMTWVDRMFRIRNGRFSWWATPTVPFAVLTDAGRTLGRLPSVYLAESEAMLSNITTVGRDVNSPPSSWPANHILIDNTYNRSLSDRLKNGLFQTIPGVLRAGTIPLVDFALYESYQMMLRRIDMLFRTENDYELVATAPKMISPNGAVSQLMSMLMRQKKKKKIILIGHSMGAIVVNEIVRRYPKAEFSKIVYMAAACTSKDFIDTIPPYLESRNLPEKPIKTKFYNLSLHPFADKDEVSGGYVLPNGSLLEWLDAYVHRIKTPLDFTFGKWNNAMGVIPLLKDLSDPVKNSIYLKGFPVKDGGFPEKIGDYGFPVKHGDFGNFTYWDPGFWDPMNTEPFQRYR